MMGSELVSRVYALTMDGKLALSAPAHRVAVGMAHAARDHDTAKTRARVYFGGWEWLAQAALNRPGPYDSADEQAVRRAVAELRDAGLIRVIGRHSGPQSKVEYELLM